MFSKHILQLLVLVRKFFLSGFLLSLLVTLAGQAVPALAQNQTADPNQSAPAANPQQQAPPPEAGGPQDNTGPYAIPKKKEEPPPPPPPARPKKVEGMPDYSISVSVPLVDVPVMVVTRNGQFIPGLKKDNFKVFEDGQPQTV